MTPNLMVVDLSHWNDVVDWDELNKTIYGVIHKATEGASNVDDQYRDRYLEASQRYMLWGAYHFLRPGDMADQARHFIDTVKAVNEDISKVLLAADYEDSGVSLDDLLEFIDHVHDMTGQRAAIYSGHVLKEQYESATDTEVNRLTQYRLWLAQYSSSPSWPDIWSSPWLWQYTDKASVPGMAAPCDGDSYPYTPVRLAREWTNWSRPPTPEPEPEPSDNKVVTVTIRISAPPNAVIEVGNG